MSRPYYGDEIPDHYRQKQQLPRQQQSPPSGRMQSRIPRPAPAAPDRIRGQPPMRPDHNTAATGRSPRRHQEQYYPEQSAWEVSQNLYDGSGYDDEYGQYDQQQQWPLPAQPHSQSPRNHGSPRRAPPPRPQRPDESPQRLDYQQPIRDPPRSAPNQRQYTNPPPGSHHGNGQWTGDGYSYPPPAYPPPRRPPPQGPLTAIPQYVEPQMPQQAAYGRANQRAPLGPPPSARRGPASYYPQVGPVHPIVEETDSMRSSTRNASSIHTAGHDSKTSFASSNAIPIGIQQGFLDRPSTRERLTTPEEYETDDAYVDAATGQRLDRFGESPPQRDQPSPEVLVRKASVGKKSKPTLTTVKSGDKIRKASAEGIASLPSQQHGRQQSRNAQPSAEDTQRSRAIAQEQLEGHTQAGASEESMVDPSTTVVAVSPEYSEPAKERSQSRTPEDVLRSGTGLLDPSSSESENEIKRKRSKELLGTAITNELHPQRSRVRSPLAPDNDERIKSILASLEKGGAISAADVEELKKPMAGLSSERPGKRRPPRLNVDAVRDAEARGSLTSLPDLIKRATKLASNLDRGKTASRLGMNWLDGANDEKRKSGSISDMLSAFPPPLATPPGSRNEIRRSYTNWSSRLRHSALPSNSDAGEVQKRGRRCCGLPLWLFVLLMLILVLLVAAAVVVPVILLVVVPDSNNENNASQAGSCHAKLTCENGGTNILSSSGFCQCLCVNGYTGNNCAVYSEQGCTTTSIGSTDNVTVGNAIPRLLSGSGNYSLPVDGQSLLGLFSASDLSCVLQNALVTFNGDSTKRDIIELRIPTPTLNKRQATTNAGAAATSEGIVFASGSTPTASATSSGATATSTGTIDNDTTLDFARVAVLYVFQESGQFNTAATAQQNLQKYFHTGENENGGTIDPKNVTLGNGYTCDLTGYSVSLSNGTTVGGSP